MTLPQLSERQSVICSMVVAGESDKDIARTLGISYHTIRAHLRSASRRIQRIAPDVSGDPRRIVLSFYSSHHGTDLFKAPPRQ
jgi:transposase